MAGSARAVRPPATPAAHAYAGTGRQVVRHEPASSTWSEQKRVHLLQQPTGRTVASVSAATALRSMFLVTRPRRGSLQLSRRGLDILAAGPSLMQPIARRRRWCPPLIPIGRAGAERGGSDAEKRDGEREEKPPGRAEPPKKNPEARTLRGRERLRPQWSSSSPLAVARLSEHSAPVSGSRGGVGSWPRPPCCPSTPGTSPWWPSRFGRSPASSTRRSPSLSLAERPELVCPVSIA
jgi:hypothetical protein